MKKQVRAQLEKFQVYKCADGQSRRNAIFWLGSNTNFRKIGRTRPASGSSYDSIYAAMKLREAGGKMLSKNLGITAVALLLLSLGAGRTGAQKAGAPAAAPVPAPAVQPHPAPELLFRMTMENESPVDSVSRLRSRRQTWRSAPLWRRQGDIVVAVGNAPDDPHIFTGLCEGPCGFTLRDRSNYFNLTGKADMKFSVQVSGFHLFRPLIKLADGTLLIGDQADGSIADRHPYEISFSEVRWLKLDPDRGVTLGKWIDNPELSKVDEVGYFDVIPGSGVRETWGCSQEKMKASLVTGTLP